MKPLYRATIPYNVPHDLTGVTFRRGQLNPRRGRDGRRAHLGVFYGDDRRKVFGKVVEVADAGHGLVAVLDLGSTHARELVELLRNGAAHYVEPIGTGITLVGFSIVPIESWAAARLRPADAPQRPANLPAPIPPPPAVNLAPVPSALFAVPPRRRL